MSEESTPTKSNFQKVLQTPIAFSQRLKQNEETRPSPARLLLLKKEFGISEDIFNETENSSCSDDEPESDKKTCSWKEYQALQTEIDERDKQRSELKLKLKTLKEKNKVYLSRLENEEDKKLKQIKQMQQCHEVQLDEKNRLIHNLELSLQKHEEHITSMEGDDECSEQKCKRTKTDFLRSVIDDVERLQIEKSNLISEVIALNAELKSTCDNYEKEINTLKVSLDENDGQISILKEENLQLRCDKIKYEAYSEQKLNYLEIERDQMKRKINEFQNRIDGDIASNEDLNKILKDKNDELETKIFKNENEYTKQVASSKSLDEFYKIELKKLHRENGSLIDRVNNLQLKLSALQSQSPDVITKVQRVEVESTVTKNQIQRAHEKIGKLQHENETMNLKLREKDIALLELKSKVAVMEHIYKKNEQLNKQNQIYAKQLVDYDLEDVLKDRKMKSMEEKVLSLEEEQIIIEKNMKEEMLDKLARKDLDLRKTQEQSSEDMKLIHKKAHILRRELKNLKNKFFDLKNENSNLKEYFENFPSYVCNVVSQANQTISTVLLEKDEQNKQLMQKYRKEMHLRKRYHNELVELKGNIRVFCRTRPLTTDYKGNHQVNIIFPDKDDDSIVYVNHKNGKQQFKVDRVFGHDATQQEVFEEVQALVTSCIDGYNVCIFAYGQTGSGKTFTMEGPKTNPGINQRALNELFENIKGRSYGEWKYQISVSMLEIYNENVRDLLSSDSNIKLEIKLNAEKEVYVPGMQKYNVNSVNDVNHVFSIGHKNRATASTDMNERSSRSHALLCITVSGINETTNSKSMGKLNLVDLAGSERVSKSGVEGARLKEAQNINKSLSCIGDVIHALRSKQSHIPYRNSKLTYLLQDSLGGDSKTLMIVQIAPEEVYSSETLASLSFAQRVKTIELGQATKRVEQYEKCSRVNSPIK